MTVYEAISTRQSVRAFADKKIPADVLKRILTAAVSAPTARNDQAHRVIALTDPAVISQLMPHQAHVGTAPCVLVLVGDNERIMRSNESARTVDCSICLSYAVLAAVEEGIQGCWLGGYDDAYVRDLLGLDENTKVVAMHTLGYPDGETPRREKKPPETLYEIR